MKTMKTLVTLVTFMALTVVITASGVCAYSVDLGQNITIWDKMGVKHEDQETEPGMLMEQAWDLEAFFLKGAQLSMVGGFDFVNGQNDPRSPYTHYDSGDLFLDVNGDAEYGPGNDNTGSGYSIVQKTFGYEYALDLDFAAGTYSIYELTNASTVTVSLDYNQESNPLSYNAGGNLIGTGNITYTTYTEDINGLQGGYHNVATFDLSFLAGQQFTSHFTTGCGNDNLMGTVPEPGTLLLFGGGLLGLLGFGRKHLKK